MPAKFHHFFRDHCNPNVDIQSFETDLKRKFRNWIDVDIYMIHQPFINNIINTNVDLLLIIFLERREGNFFKIDGKYYIAKDGSSKQVYLHNIILPIKFIDEFKNDEVEINNYPIKGNWGKNSSILVNNNVDIEFINEIYELKYGTESFLKKAFKDDKLRIEVIPVIWILSNKREKYFFPRHNIIQAHKFGFEELEAFLKFCEIDYFSSIPFNISHMEFTKKMEYLKEILESESKISKLTKAKIDRIALQHHRDNQIYEKYLVQENSNMLDHKEFVLGHDSEKIINLPNHIQADKNLSNNLVVIQGKAGSGKTTELILLMKKQLENGGLVRYITYNKLLKNSIYKFKELAKFEGSRNLTVRTIHKFMFDISKKIGTLDVMGFGRYKELISILENHISFIENNIISKFGIEELYLDREKDNVFQYLVYLLNKYQQSNRNEVAEFREFQKFISNDKDKFKEMEVSKVLENYRERQERRIKSLVDKKIFLSDYYGVLDNIYLSLTDLTEFYDKYHVDEMEIIVSKSKFEPYNLQDIKQFQTMVNRSRGAFSKYIAVIDEGQDFHSSERDILFKLFHKKNMVVATGGKEQLIRHQLECDWFVDNQGRKHNTILINKKNKSYRLKKGIADLCNKLASRFEINLNLETGNNDSGNVIISSNEEDIQKVFDLFVKNGEDNELNPCESVYIIIEAESKLFWNKFENVRLPNDAEDEEDVGTIIITENQVAVAGVDNLKSKPNFQGYIETEGLAFYYANMEGEEDKAISNSEYLVSFYESCRGLESWSVICLELDKFYDRKKNEDDALKFLSDDLLITDEERRQRYAMTWVLMALTRAMDGLFIYISDENSELGKILLQL